MKLDGKVAIITGASKGIGEGIAKVFAKHGAKCMLVARGNQIFELANELRNQGYDVTGIQADVANYDEMKVVVNKTVEKYGKVDVLVCNAGICVLEEFESTDYNFTNRDKHFDINIKGVWNITRAAIGELKNSTEGSIVIMSSVTGDMVADPGEVAYATSKAALVGFTKAMAREVADYNVRVNAICPGYVLTPLVWGMAEQSNPDNPEDAIRAIADAVPLKRLASPEEVGELAAFLGSNESSYITGAQIVIDGGSTLPETSSMGQ